METKQEATKACKELLKLLKGKGWKANVYGQCNNWHYSATNGPIQVYPTHQIFGNKYWCMISDRVDGYGGSCLWTGEGVKYFKDPNHAVKDQLEKACIATKGILQALRAAEKASGIEGFLDKKLGFYA